MGTDISGIMDSPIDQPMATVSDDDGSYQQEVLTNGQIFFNSFGTKGTLAIWTFVVLAQ